MVQITKIINSNGKIEIHHSDEIQDKNTYYRIRFNSVYTNYFDFVNKDRLQSKKPYFSQLSCILYLSSDKFLESPEKWIALFKKAYKEKYSNYDWYRELVLEEVDV